MSLTVSQFCKHLDLGADKIRQLSKDFCQPLDINVFAYARVYDNGYISWLTSDPDQDRYLIESGSLNEDPLIDTKEALKEGLFLWFNDRKFPGSETFYRERAQRFKMDHGMTLVKHHKDYLEFCCFSGLLAKQPLYQLFMNEQELFRSFMEHFTKQIDRRMLHLLEQAVTLSELKEEYGTACKLRSQISDKRASLVAACGWKHLLMLSKREKECLVLLKQGYTYEAIGKKLKLSERTVEHYLDSVKNKLNLTTRAELCLAGEKLLQLGLINLSWMKAIQTQAAR